MNVLIQTKQPGIHAVEAMLPDSRSDTPLSICRISVSDMNDDQKQWAISAWYTYGKDRQRKGLGKQAMQAALSACLDRFGRPDAIRYIWNGANGYVLDWITNRFDAVCSCPISVRKKNPDDDWDSHIYELDIEKVFRYFELKTRQKG